MGLERKFYYNRKKLVASVTGASGFVGETLVQYLLKMGFIVKVLTRNKHKTFPKGVEVFVGDISSPSYDFRGFLSGCQILFNCAGEMKDSNLMDVTHIDGTNRMLKAVSEEFLSSGTKIHWVQLSSVGVYGRILGVQNELSIITEDSEIKPIGKYETTKAESDKLVMDASVNNYITFSILRPSIIIGNQMPNKSFFQLLNALKEKNFFYIGSRDSIATYVHVKDVIEALILCATSTNAKNQVFNLSNDCRLSEIVNSVSIACGNKLNFLCVPEKLLRLLVSIISRFIKTPLTISRIDALTSKTSYPHAKLENILGFIPKYNIPQFAAVYVKKMNSSDI